MFLRKKGMVDMQNMLAQFCMTQLGSGPVGEIHMLSKSGQNSHNYFRDKINDANFHQLLSRGEAALVTKRNDVLVVCPSSHTWYGDSHVEGAALTWDKQNTHLLGMAPFSKGGGMRSRFGHSGKTMANFMTVSGANNLYKNLYWMHGSATGGASDVTVMTLTGARNVFDGCHFGGPNNQTQASSANYAQIVLTGAEQNYFKDCLFGGMNSVHRDAANTILKLNTGQNQNNVFENCVFWSRAAATTPYFINIAAAATTGGTWRAIFLNCQFINMTPLHGSYDLAVGIASTAAESDENYLYFDSRCNFAGVTDIIADAAEEMIWFGHATPQTNYNNGAAIDNVVLGLAQHVNHTA